MHMYVNGTRLKLHKTDESLNARLAFNAARPIRYPPWPTMIGQKQPEKNNQPHRATVAV